VQNSASTDVARPQGGQTGPLDPATLLSLYREQERRIYHLCLGYLKNSADAEDATQEAFVKAARHLK
jgi:DNA-directed RNA polymerase specialized sigma24 family protein